MNNRGIFDRNDHLLLTSEDKADGFSMMADGRGNTTLLKWGKSVAWFSAVVTGEVLREFLELVKDCERNAKGSNVSVSKTEQVGRSAKM